MAKTRNARLNWRDTVKRAVVELAACGGARVPVDDLVSVVVQRLPVPPRTERDTRTQRARRAVLQYVSEGGLPIADGVVDLTSARLARTKPRTVARADFPDILAQVAFSFGPDGLTARVVSVTYPNGHDLV